MKLRDTGVVILAAGRSERMKERKAFLSFDEKSTFIERILSAYSGWGCSEIVLVTNKEAADRMKIEKLVAPDVTVVINNHLEFERFYSVKLGLAAIRSSEFSFIQNIDNPFIGSEILDLLYEQRDHEKYVSPVFQSRGGHPVLLNRKNIRYILNRKENSANFKEVLAGMDCRNVEMPDDKILININSPEDYSGYFITGRTAI
jgi:CTP:molybdopterin cytidylyltransferase MocA